VHCAGGRTTLYSDVSGGKYGQATVLHPDSPDWAHATVLTSGEYGKAGNWDLLICWVDGEVDSYPDTSTTGLGKEKRMINQSSLKAKTIAITTGRFTGNAFVDDLVVKWDNGSITQYSDTTFEKLGTAKYLVPKG